MLPNAPGGTQVSTRVRGMRGAPVGLRDMGRIRARPRRACASRGTTVRQPMRPSACCRILSPVASPGIWTISNSWSRTSRRRAASKRRPIGFGRSRTSQPTCGPRCKKSKLQRFSLLEFLQLSRGIFRALVQSLVRPPELECLCRSAHRLKSPRSSAFSIAVSDSTESAANGTSRCPRRLPWAFSPK
jgi:hypothetical protein